MEKQKTRDLWLSTDRKSAQGKPKLTIWVNSLYNLGLSQNPKCSHEPWRKKWKISGNSEGFFYLLSWDVSLLYHADCTPLLWREYQLHPVSYLSQAPVSIDSVWAGVISQLAAPGDSMTLCHTRKWDCVIQERAKRKCAYAAEPEANCPDLDMQQLGYLYRFHTLMLVRECFCGFLCADENVWTLMEFCIFCCFHKNIKFKYNSCRVFQMRLCATS